MEIIAEIIAMSAPLLLVSLGALVTEYTGSLAIFLEGCITSGAFIYTVVCTATGSGTVATIAAITVTAVPMLLLSVFARRTHANTFICGLAVNLGIGGLVPLFSQTWFATQGVVRLPSAGLAQLSTTPSLFRTDTIISYFFAAFCCIFVYKTTIGLRLRMCCRERAFLNANGINTDRYRDLSWGVAAGTAAAAGCILAARMEAYIPGISSGNGWIALAVIFMGLRTIPGTVIATIVFTAAGYAANVLQGSGILSGTVIAAVPYVIALVCFTAAGYVETRHQKNATPHTKERT